jgi:predicted ATPase
LTGEPGIGKSTLAEHIAGEATARGARVAWGRCWEAGGAPAYWPWIQVFRGLGMDDDPFAGAMADVALAPAGARFAAFDRAIVALKAKAAQDILALFLDDLHAADAPSLLLLLLLARQLRDARMLVVGAYRDAEVTLNPEIASLLAKIAREAEVLPLPRLASEDVAKWMREAVSGASAGEAAELYRLTEGHPLFVVEALRVARGAGQPVHRSAGLEAVLDEHLGRLSAGARAILEVAAVLGRDFTTTDVAATASAAVAIVHRALNEAVAASVVVPIGDAERFRFAHVLLRDRIYAKLLPSTRAALHFAAGKAILARDEKALAAAVHHFFEGEGAGPFERVAEVAAAAAEASLSVSPSKRRHDSRGARFTRAPATAWWPSSKLACASRSANR